LPILGSDSGEGISLTRAKAQKIIDMVDLSRDAYENDSKGIPGYPRLSKAEIKKLGLDPSLYYSDKDKSGFYASIYKDQKNGGYAVAMRGTEGEFNDVISDAAQGIGISNVQYDKTYELAKDLRRNPTINKVNMTVTGHSLGGGLAATTGSITGYPTYTFNAAGVHKNTMKKYGISDANTKHVQAYNTEKDPLNMIQDNRKGAIASIGAVASIINPLGGLIGPTASATGALPKAIGTRTKIPTDDGYGVGAHNTDGMRKALAKNL